MQDALSVTERCRSFLNNLHEIVPKPPAADSTAEHVQSGAPIPKGLRVRTFSPEQWEEFVEEWATTLLPAFKKVRRFGGSGDLGIDIAGFSSDSGLKGRGPTINASDMVIRLDH